uniref:Uncharacterized protein n=1 Tax=Noctiluca scintillans TaxID=2966 RepID=A0A7S1AHI6_NOCSC
MEMQNSQRERRRSSMQGIVSREELLKALDVFLRFALTSLEKIGHADLNKRHNPKVAARRPSARILEVPLHREQNHEMMAYDTWAPNSLPSCMNHGLLP